MKAKAVLIDVVDVKDCSHVTKITPILRQLLAENRGVHT